MAVFTAIATSILAAVGVAGTILGSAMLFNLAVGVVAAGLAMGTAKLLGVYDSPSGGNDPGVKVQLAPATDNKVAKLYGKNFTGGIITDAEIKNQNKTMAYCLVLSEYVDGETWTVNDIYRGDAKLNFNVANVISQVDPNATSTTDIANKIRVRVYAGGSASANQVFPTTNATPAYGSGVAVMDTWTSANSMEDLVFAIVEVDYDPENNLTGLGAITFDIENSVHEPGDVLLDYLTHPRYGAALTTDQIDVDSITDWNTYCTTQQAYHSTLGDIDLDHDKFRIDGALSMFNTVKDNINTICQNSAAFFAYNGKTGKFHVVPLRAATQTELDAAFEFDDDNIVSSISFASSELFSQFNAVEVEYPSYNQKDQTDVYYSQIDPSLKHPNEPDNVLQFRLDMCNDRARAAQLANIDINQNRLSTVLEFTADHGSMIVDVGDVVKFSNTLYGYDQKLFRVMRSVEREDSEAVLTVKFTLLEYDADVYDDLLTADDLPKAPSGINNYYATYSNVSLNVETIYVYEDASQGNVLVYDGDTGAQLSNISIDSISPADIIFTGGANKTKPWYGVGFELPNGNLFYDQATLLLDTFGSDDSSVASGQVFDFRAPGERAGFDGVDELILAVPISGAGVNSITPEQIRKLSSRITLTDTATSVKTLPANTPRIEVDAKNSVSKEEVAVYTAGAQFSAAPAANLSMPQDTTLREITSVETYDLLGAEIGEYPVTAFGSAVGTINSVSDFALGVFSLVKYEHSVTGDLQGYQGTNVITKGNLAAGSSLPDFPINFTIDTDPTTHGLAAEYVPYELDVSFVGYTEADSTGGQRGYANLYYNIEKITKGTK